MPLLNFLLGSAFSDDRGVSPVIGVVLLVSLTVVLSVSVGAFGLGYVGGLDRNDPLASFQLTQDGSTATLSYTSGDPLDGEDVYL
ncbi:hypothetical protein DEQ92_21715, partial [Haloferax sp. Atlit-6N]|uniref:type IV pilin n=1 Tax=Haloferax sp. Atlit-6N TaxID=2077205 RepID=UPI000E24061B